MVALFLFALLAADDVETIDAVEVVEVEAVAAADTPTAPGPAAAGPRSLVELSGRIHPAVVHFPIAWVFLLLVLELLALGSPSLLPASYAVHVFSVLSMLPATLSGLLRMESLTPHYAPELLEDALAHRNIMFAVLLMLLAALTLRPTPRVRLSGGKRGAYLGLLGLATVLVLIGGHQGALLVWGDDFLSLNP